MRFHIIATIAGIVVSLTSQAQLSDSLKQKKWTSHFQLTAINQEHQAFPITNKGVNTLIHEAESKKLSLTSTYFVGASLWKGASFYFNPELAGGQGLSGAKGVAGFTNGETFRIGNVAPVLYIARLYFRQHIALPHSDYEWIEEGVNQVREKLPSSRITISIGKFGLADYFDQNSISHDPRSQFLNWSLMSNGAWDYAADTRGYTQGAVVELVKPSWAIRFSAALVPLKANGLELDWHISKAQALTVEAEKSWSINNLPGKIRLLVFRNASQAPKYLNTLKEVQLGDSTSVEVYSGNKNWGIYSGVKYGWGFNAEQYFTNQLGAFFKASWNDGKTATWAFTEIDRSVSGGVQVKGKIWRRPNDIIGLAQVINGISTDHQAFLKAGLAGFMIGDGNMNYQPEAITEMYYKASLLPNFTLSADYQLVRNPGYNANNKGPVHVFALRGHFDF